MMYEPRLHVVLHQPEIPYNTGSVGRTCLAVGAKLWLVRPLGFRVDDYYLRRAGLDYWEHLEWEVVDDWATLVVRYPGGIAATLSMSFSRQDRRRGFEIVGQEGTLRFSLEEGQLLVCRGDAQQVLWDGRGYDLNQMYADMLADVLRAVSQRLSPPVPLAAGLQTLAMMNQIRSLTDV